MCRKTVLIPEDHEESTHSGLRQYFQYFLHKDFGKRETPSALYVHYLAKKVKETGILIDKPIREKPKAVHTLENTAAVAQSVRQAPSTSIHRRSQQLKISETSLRRILGEEIGITPFKVQLVK